MSLLLASVALATPGDLVASEVHPGLVTHVVVTGVPAGSQVDLYLGDTIGAGPCGPARCFGITSPRLLRTATADAAGRALVRVPVPASAVPGSSFALQAFIRRGRRFSDTLQVTVEPATDGDGDGYDSSVDCNDRRADRFPGAPEVCFSGDPCETPADGADDDCDGVIDDGCPTVHTGTWRGTEVWGPGDHLACGVQVARRSNLTVIGPATVQVDRVLEIGGSLVVTGLDPLDPSVGPVVFTAIGESPTAGDWDGISITGEAQIIGADIQYATTGIVSVGRSLELTSSSVCDGGTGLRLDGDGSATITDVLVCDNADAGIRDPGTALDVTLTDTRVVGNGVAVVGGYSVLAGLDETDDLTGNALDEIQLPGPCSGTYSNWLTAPTVWRSAGATVTHCGLHVPDGLTFGPGLTFSGPLFEAHNLAIAGTDAAPVRLVDTSITYSVWPEPEATHPWSHVEITGDETSLMLPRGLQLDHLHVTDVHSPNFGISATDLVLSDALVEDVSAYSQVLTLWGSSTLDRVVVTATDSEASDTAAMALESLDPSDAAVLRDVRVSSVGSRGIAISGPMALVDLTDVVVDGAEGIGLSLTNVNSSGSLTRVDVQHVTASTNARGEGIYVSGDFPFSGRMNEVRSVNNVYPMVAENITGVDQLLASFNGNLIDEVVVERGRVIDAVELDEVGVPYRFERGIQVDGGATLRLDGDAEYDRVTLLFDGDGIRVSNGGQLLGTDCDLTGAPGTGIGVDARSGAGNVVSLYECDIHGFPDHGIAVDYAWGQSPQLGLALAGGTNAFENGGCGVSCGCGANCAGADRDGDGIGDPSGLPGCSLYVLETGRPVFMDATQEENLMFDNVLGAFCD